MKKPTVRLGELLVQRKLIAPAQLDAALADQRLSKEFLGAILVRRGLIKPDDLLRVLSEQFDLPCERLQVEQTDWRVAKQFPASAFADGTCFPIRADGQSVTVAIANPLNAWALSTMEKAAGFRKVVPVLVTEQDLRDVLEAYRRQSLRSIEHLLKDEDAA